MFTEVNLVYYIRSKQHQWMGINIFWLLRVTLKFATSNSSKFKREIKESRMWHGAYFKSAKNHRMNTSLAVNAILKSLLLIFPSRWGFSTKQRMEILPQPCETILISYTPMRIQAYCRLKN